MSSQPPLKSIGDQELARSVNRSLAVEVQTTMEFLDSRLRELMVEQESVNERQRQLEAEIKELRQRLERSP